LLVLSFVAFTLGEEKKKGGRKRERKWRVAHIHQSLVTGRGKGDRKGGERERRRGKEDNFVSQCQLIQLFAVAAGLREGGRGGRKEEGGGKGGGRTLYIF